MLDMTAIVVSVKAAIISALAGKPFVTNEKGEEVVTESDMRLTIEWENDEIVVKDVYPGTVHARFKIVTLEETREAIREKARQEMEAARQAEIAKFISESPKMLISARGINNRVIDTVVPRLTEAMWDLIHVQGKKINAIKLYRELTGMGLADAKDACEQGYKMECGLRRVEPNSVYLATGYYSFNEHETAKPL